MVTKEKFKVLLYFSAALLIGLNVTGLGLSLRNPDIYQERSTKFEEDITLTETELYDAIVRTEDSDQEYVIKLNQALNHGIAHYWRDEGIHKYNLRIPIHENYLLYFASYLYPRAFEKYTFYNYKKAIERGVGLCSQHSIIISQILEQNGIASRLVALSGHVVAMAQVEKESDTWWVVDPDFGVVVEHSISEIEKNPEIIRPYYEAKGYEPKKVNGLVMIYGKDGNRIWKGPKDYLGRKFQFEKLSYVAIWVIPIMLLLSSLSLAVTAENGRKTLVTLRDVKLRLLAPWYLGNSGSNIPRRQALTS